mmetsp:Transcript_26215/g.43864  ORF Transcript_26215/g.43864 Transcript_26215/m.43864 type:complete len:312 (+) Transcript_26215:676-1611(+)
MRGRKMTGLLGVAERANKPGTSAISPRSGPGGTSCVWSGRRSTTPSSTASSATKVTTPLPLCLAACRGWERPPLFLAGRPLRREVVEPKAVEAVEPRSRRWEEEWCGCHLCLSSAANGSSAPHNGLSRYVTLLPPAPATTLSAATPALPFAVFLASRSGLCPSSIVHSPRVVQVFAAGGSALPPPLRMAPLNRSHYSSTDRLSRGHYSRTDHLSCEDYWRTNALSRAHRPRPHRSSHAHGPPADRIAHAQCEPTPPARRQRSDPPRYSSLPPALAPRKKTPSLCRRAHSRRRGTRALPLQRRDGPRSAGRR